MSKAVHHNEHLSHTALAGLLEVDNPPAEMLALVGRRCYVAIPDNWKPKGITFPRVNGRRVAQKVKVTEKHDARGNLVDYVITETGKPSPHRIGGLQKIYDGSTAFRVYEEGGNTFGRPALRDEVILIED